MYASHRFTDNKRDFLKQVLSEVKSDRTGGKGYIIALKKIAYVLLPARILDVLHE